MNKLTNIYTLAESLGVTDLVIQRISREHKLGAVPRRGRWLTSDEVKLIKQLVKTRKPRGRPRK